MDISSAATPLAAFIAGAITSIHCAGMCGPLTCAMFGRCGKTESQRASAIYQLSRVISYTLIGLALGAAGHSAAAIFTDARFVPWALALVFLAFAFGLEKRITPPALTVKMFARLTRARTPFAQPILLGIATPFLPCGPLYLMFGIALVTGSALAGAALTASFALGTLPFYWFAQSQLLRLQTRLSPATLQRTRQGVSLLSAALLVWRASANGGLGLANAVCH
jgi:sulfite exporter TauE/SafE